VYVTDEGDFLDTVVTHKKANVSQVLILDIIVNALRELGRLILKIFEVSILY